MPSSKLGSRMVPPYNGWSDYTDAVASAVDSAMLAKTANSFPRVSIINEYGMSTSYDATTYPNLNTLNSQRYIAKLKSANPSVYLQYGLTSNLLNITAYPEYSHFNPSNYTRYRTYLLQEAQWAQDNGIQMFCVGNENLISTAHSTSIGMTPSVAMTRSSNVVTATFSYDHGLTTGDYIAVGSGTDTSYRVADSEVAETVQCTVLDSTRITYPSTGSDGSSTGTYKVYWSAYEVVRKVKALAVAVRAVYSGTIQYNESQGHTNPWRVLGITPGVDLDMWGLNCYGDGTEATTTGYDTWKAEVDQCYAVFGNTMIMSEWNVSQSTSTPVDGLLYSQRGFLKAVCDETARRIRYLNTLDITQLYFYTTIWENFGLGCFYNTYPSQSYGERYVLGEFTPLYNIIREERIDRLFLGTGQI